MTNLNHTNIVKLLGVSLDRNPFYIVTEFCEQGSLLEYLKTRGQAAIEQKDLVGFARDIAFAMRYLHSKNLEHRDLTTRNVLIHENGTAKVSNFGQARKANFDRVEVLPLKLEVWFSLK